ncbi:MAG: Rpn family recombination-promoting nuclease/putative transposase [Sarcina sp.]
MSKKKYKRDEKKVHDYDAAWKTILEAFESEIVELLFPEIYEKINWNIESEALDNELLEIQKEIFSKEETKKVISDKIIKVRLKDNESKILFIHVEVQSYFSKEQVFAERMFRYFYRIWDKFRYKYEDYSDIVGSAIYTYKGSIGKDKKYIYKLEDLEEDILTYNFRTIDVEDLELANINDNNPLKLVFKIAKRLLETGASDEEIFVAKVELFNELVNYKKVRTMEQRKALTYFLEYLFLIQDNELSKEFKAVKDRIGGGAEMSIDEIRELYLEEKGRKEGIEEGREEAKIEMAKNLLDVLDDEIIATKTNLPIEIVRKIREASKLEE